jgi:hypothetical protein
VRDLAAKGWEHPRVLISTVELRSESASFSEAMKQVFDRPL